jgi:hypothetical protein
VSRGTWVCHPGSPIHFAYRILTFCDKPFQDSSAMNRIFNFPTELQPHPVASRYPPYTTLAGLNVYEVWALPSSLAATGGIAFAFSSSGY